MRDRHEGGTRIPLDEAIRRIRADASQRQFVEDVYLGQDVDESARRFAASLEFAEVLAIVGDRLRDAVVLDVGSGVGIAARGFAAHGARMVLALEPDPSDLVGWRAMRRGRLPANVHPLSAFAESLPLPNASVDVVYARQVLHHIPDLPAAMRECARVLRPGGLLLACREHVVNDEKQLRSFLAAHPIHRLAGGENAYSLDAYTGALAAAGFDLQASLAPWQSPINVFPAVRSREEFADYPRVLLAQRFGRAGALLARLPGVPALVRRWTNRELPGRPYTFIAVRP